MIAWAMSLGGLLCLVVYIAWTLVGESLDAREAALYPIGVAKAIFSQFGQARFPTEWNLPLLSVVVWLAWIVGVGGLGSTLGRFYAGRDSMPVSARVVCEFALGFTAFGLIQLLVGLLGLAPVPLIPVFFVATVATLFSSERRRRFFELPRAVAWRWKQMDRPGQIVALVAIVGIAMLMVPASVPPVQSDGVRYHLAAPQEYLKSGAIDYIPGNAYSNMPFLVEMHFLAALACNAPEASQFMHLFLALMTALGIFSLVRALTDHNEHASPALAALPALLYLATPMSGILAGWPFTDHGIAFLLVALMLMMVRCMEGEGARSAWLMLGVIAGGLIGTKYTMGPVAVAAVFVAFFFGRHVKCPLRNTGAACAAMGAVGGIWFLKNAFFTGNPFYPLASQLFPGGEWNAVNDEFLRTRAGVKGLGTGIAQFFAVPFNATFHWVRFESHNPGVTLLLSTIFLIGGTLVSLRPTRNRVRLAVIFIALVSYVTWFYSYQSNRLLLPILALALALTPVQIFSFSRAARRIFAAVTVTAAGLGFAWAVQWSWVTTALSPPPLPYLLGAQSEQAFRYKSLTYAQAFDYLNRNVKPGERVLLAGEHRIYGARFDAIWSDWFDTPALARILRENSLTSMEELLAWLRENHVPWIMINERELAPQLDDHFRPWFTDAEWEIFEALRTFDKPGADVINLPPGVTIIHLEPQP